MNADGSLRRELRDPSEVFNADSLRSFEQLPVTNTHPYEQVTASNAKGLMVGANDSNVTRDDDHVRTMLMVADAPTIAEMDAKKKVQVSCGYTCDYDPTPGKHPVYGDYDGRQMNIRGNHIALVPHARAGETARVRMDAAARMVKDFAVMVAEDDVFTSIVKGHQHTICPEYAEPGSTRWTSRAISPGAVDSHTHEWMIGEDGKLTISTNEGHTHTAEIVWKPADVAADVSTDVAVADAAMKTAARNPQKPRAKEIDMADKTTPTAIAAATAELAKETQRADAAVLGLKESQDALALANTRADTAEGALAVSREKLAEAEAFKLDQVKLDSAEAKIVMLTKELADEKKLRLDAEDPKRFDAAVEKRRHVIDAVRSVCGERQVCDGVSNRDLQILVLGKLGKAPDPKESDAHIEARFDERVSNFNASEAAVARVRQATHSVESTKRADTAEDARNAMIERNRGAWQAPTK